MNENEDPEGESGRTPPKIVVGPNVHIVIDPRVKIELAPGAKVTIDPSAVIEKRAPRTDELA